MVKQTFELDEAAAAERQDDQVHDCDEAASFIVARSNNMKAVTPLKYPSSLDNAEKRHVIYYDGEG